MARPSRTVKRSSGIRNDGDQHRRAILYAAETICRSVSRSAVDDDQFPVRPGLTKEGGDALPGKFKLIPAGNDERRETVDARLVHWCTSNARRRQQTRSRPRSPQNSSKPAFLGDICGPRSFFRNRRRDSPLFSPASSAESVGWGTATGKAILAVCGSASSTSWAPCEWSSKRVSMLIPTSCSSCPPCGSEFLLRRGNKNRDRLPRQSRPAR